MASYHLVSLLGLFFHWGILTLFPKLDFYTYKIRIYNLVVYEWVTLSESKIKSTCLLDIP